MAQEDLKSSQGKLDATSTTELFRANQPNFEVNITAPAGSGQATEVKQPSGFLESIFGAAGLVAAWLFILGWRYLYTYYQHFGVNINSLNFPVYHYLAFSVPQFTSFGWLRVLSVFLATFLLLVLAWVGMKTQSKPLAFFIIACCLALVWGGSYLARLNGSSAASQDMAEGPGSSLPVILMELKDRKNLNASPEIDEALQPAIFRLLLENGDRLFVFKPPGPDADRIQVLEIGRNDVSTSMRLVPLK
jgi:hypothetical protein